MNLRYAVAALMLALAGCASNSAAPPDPQLAPPTTAADKPALSADLSGYTWQWISFADGKSAMDIPHPERYTVTFSAGRVAIQADCNRGVGTYQIEKDYRISFQQLGMTRALCLPDSLDTRFMQLLERVVSYHPFEGDLLLELPMDSGTLRFRQAPKMTGR
jgi:para-nitrobenzyl esterase